VHWCHMPGVLLALAGGSVKSGDRMFDVPDLAKDIITLATGIGFIVMAIAQLISGRLWVKESRGHHLGSIHEYWWWIAIEAIVGIILVVTGVMGIRADLPED
jgi:hypothetical protein